MLKRAALSSLTKVSAEKDCTQVAKKDLPNYFNCKLLNAAPLTAGRLTIERMAWCQCSHIPPHQVCAVLKHTVHCWEDSLQDLTALITVVHPYVFWPLQWHISITDMAASLFSGWLPAWHVCTGKVQICSPQHLLPCTGLVAAATPS